MGHGNLAGLVSTLLGIRNLVFDLDGTSTGFDHALGEQIGGLFVTEARIDVSDDWHHVCFVVVDLLNDAVHITAIGSCFVQFDKDMAQFPRIGLLEEGIDLFDQIRHGSLFVHALVWQWPKLRAECRDHPA